MNTPKQMRVSDGQIEEALRAFHGLYTLAAAAVGCSPRTITRRVEASETLRRTLAEIVESRLDVAEDRLMVAVGRGESWAVCFYLKCKGKQRGYIERQEVAVSIPPVSAENITDAELEKIIGEDQRTVGENRVGEAVVKE